MPNPDFPGIARFLRELEVPSALHVHFNGAGGNIGAGKYNDGTPENRWTLARRLADGMASAWANTMREPIDASAVSWTIKPVSLPTATHLAIDKLEADLRARGAQAVAATVPSKIAWLRRCQEGRQIETTCLRLGRARILHLPGELFVEYQLAAKSLKPGNFVAMAAYGDYAPAYIGTAVAYEQGGYETGPTASNVAPGVELVLMQAIRDLLKD
jgi:hypothetical protein